MNNKVLAVAIISLFVFGNILSGCTKVPTKAEVDESNEDINIAQEGVNIQFGDGSEDKEADKIMAKYCKLAEKEDVSAYEIVKFIDTNIEKVSKEQADEMITMLESFHINDRFKYWMIFDEKYDEMTEVFGDKFDESKIANIKDEELKSAIIEAINGDYEVYKAGEKFVVYTDYSKLKKYSTYLSNEINEYINIWVKQWANVDNKWDALYELITDTENYILNYPKSKKINDIKMFYGMFMENYIKGTEDQPIFDTETGKLSDKALQSFNQMIKNTKYTKTADIIKEYIEVLEKNDYKFTENVKQYQYKLANKLSD